MEMKKLLVKTEGRAVDTPQVFARRHSLREWGVFPEDVRTLSRGPRDPDYWRTWRDVLCYAELVDDQRYIWYLSDERDGIYAISSGEKVEPVIVEAPAAWVKAVLDGDFSSFDKDEIKEICKWISDNGLPESIGSFCIGLYKGQVTELAEYIFPYKRHCA